MSFILFEESYELAYRSSSDKRNPLFTNKAILVKIVIYKKDSSD